MMREPFTPLSEMSRTESFGLPVADRRERLAKARCSIGLEIVILRGIEGPSHLKMIMIIVDVIGAYNIVHPWA